MRRCRMFNRAIVNDATVRQTHQPLSTGANGLPVRTALRSIHGAIVVSAALAWGVQLFTFAVVRLAGRSKVIVVGDEARTLVLKKDGAEVRRVALTLVAGQVNPVRY